VQAVNFFTDKQPMPTEQQKVTAEPHLATNRTAAFTKTAASTVQYCTSRKNGKYQLS
jgi:hypothetical protein